MLASADESGLLAAVDLRLMGGEAGSRALLWRAKSPYGGVTCLAAATHSATGIRNDASGGFAKAIMGSDLISNPIKLYEVCKVAKWKRQGNSVQTKMKFTRFYIFQQSSIKRWICNSAGDAMLLSGSRSGAIRVWAADRGVVVQDIVPPGVERPGSASKGALPHCLFHLMMEVGQADLNTASLSSGLQNQLKFHPVLHAGCFKCNALSAGAEHIFLVFRHFYRQKHPYFKPTGFFGDAFRGSRPSAAAAVTGLAVCPEGLLSCDLHGTVLFHPLSV